MKNTPYSCIKIGRSCHIHIILVISPTPTYINLVFRVFNFGRKLVKILGGNITQIQHLNHSNGDVYSHIFARIHKKELLLLKQMY